MVRKIEKEGREGWGGRGRRRASGGRKEVVERWRGENVRKKKKERWSVRKNRVGERNLREGERETDCLLMDGGESESHNMFSLLENSHLRCSSDRQCAFPPTAGSVCQFGCICLET